MATATQLEKSPASPTGRGSLGNGLGAAWTRLQVRWAGMAPRQRSWSILTVLLTMGGLGMVAWYTLRPDWRILYADLDAEDARQIGQTLTQAQIPFEVAAAGGTIRVTAAQLDKARLATAGKGGVRSGRMGFELFDKPNWVGSEFDEQVNFQRALEGELEHTVGTLDDVASARVHLVMAHDSLFRDQDRPAKASVVLKLRHHALADGESDAIRNLVASAVDGLSPDRVVLVDAAGLPLGPKTAEALRLSAEQAFEEKLIATLEPVTGVGNVRASVTLDYDDSTLEETKETYDPTQSATLSMQRSEQVSGAQPLPAGVPGSASNAPNAQPLPVYPPQSTAPQSAKSESSTFGVTKAVRHVAESPGRVRRLTAAILVNDRQLQGAVKNKAAVWQPRTADELKTLTALAQAAVGFESARGDIVTVQDLAFDANRAAAPGSMLSRTLHVAEGSPMLVRAAVLLIALLAFLSFAIRPALRQAVAAPLAAEKTLPAGSSGEPAATVLAAAPPDPARQRTQELLEQVAHHVKEEPTQSSRLLQSWIHSE